MNDLAASVFALPTPASVEFLDEVVTHPLSHVLRARTEVAHQKVEDRLGLPESIRSLPEYRACLLRFYQLYRPIESQIQRMSGWSPASLDPSSIWLSVRLAADLQALGVSVPDIASAPESSLPTLRDIASALGARYVLEGSALGSQYMLPHLQQTLGTAMTGADSFFRGRGTETGAYWKRFRDGLDRFGEMHPEQVPAVVSGANATFEAIGLWMRP